jgi:hypothetical protein
MICTNCGTVAEPTRQRTGGKALGLGLFVSAGFLAGVKWYKGCPACGAPNMVPENSPIGRKLLSELPPAVAAIDVPLSPASPRVTYSDLRDEREFTAWNEHAFETVAELDTWRAQPDSSVEVAAPALTPAADQPTRFANRDEYMEWKRRKATGEI